MYALKSSPSSDHNLLFGVLALQMDFVNRDALIQAMHAWVLHKAAPLGQILLDQGALRADTHDLLESMVQKHLELHDGDVQKSLATISSLDSARQQLEQIADADLHQSLAHVAARRDGEAECLATQPPATANASMGQRFHILRPHARGGLGEVFVAQDAELRREVALKEIQDRHADDPNSRARFVMEAEITGGLEHPCIVPVYGLGTYPDGRPYYAMRFIQGDSLQETIERFHAAEKSPRDPGERTLALRQLLGHFVDVCNAIAYAHSRGVLHRDIKPGNVMLGPYGETLVIDWGLAKTLGECQKPANGTVTERPLKPTMSDSTVETQMGSAVGTPAFMPPEQAAGQLDRLGPASDTYSLGATLYCLLTGKAPFEGTEVGEVLRRVQRGEMRSPRAVKTDVPAALEAVCLKALALRPEDRYATPRELAADVERWLADEPVRAWREPWRLRAGRWARRHQTLVAASATALLLTLLAVMAGAWLLDRERTEQRHGVESALEDVRDLQSQRRWRSARAVLHQARERLGAAGPRDLHDKLERAQAGLDLVARLDEIRLRRAVLVAGHYDTSGTDRHFETAFREAGLGEVGSDAAAAADWVTASGVRDALIAALDVWAACVNEPQRHDWIVDVARRAAGDPWRDRVQQPAAWNDPRVLVQLAATDEAAHQSPNLLCVIGCRIWALKGDAEPVLRLAQQRYPKDFWINVHLANFLLSKGKYEDAVGFDRVALALRPATAIVHFKLGYALSHRNRRSEAIDQYREAIKRDPHYALAHNNLSHEYREAGQVDEAIAACKKAMELDPRLALAPYNLGLCLAARGEPDRAIDAYRKALELDPGNANVHNALGNALIEMDDPDAALAAFHKGIVLNPRLALIHRNFALALKNQGDLKEAVREFRQAAELDGKNAWGQEQLARCQRLLALDGKSEAILKGNVHPATAAERLDVAEWCLRRQRPAAAVRHYAAAFTARPQLAEDSRAFRYDAVAAAARAAAGRGEDAKRLTEEERHSYHQQAIHWLRDHLAMRARQIEHGTPQEKLLAQKKLRLWQRRTDLAVLRDEAVLAKRPDAARADCRKLWDDVAALLKK